MDSLLHYIIIVNLFIFTSISVAYFPGLTLGSFSVTDSGTTIDTLPVTTMAGVNGISPDLSASYESNGGDPLKILLPV